jgi:hypothetical protein
MFKVTCLVDPRRIVGTPRELGLGSPRKMVPAQRYLLKQIHAINQSNAIDMCYMNA